MTSLNKLTKTKTRSKKRIGRGYGSGKGGHTTIRGSKGSKARSKVRLGFEGGQTALIHRLPLKRGAKNRPAGKKPVVVNLKYLNLLPKGTLVTVETLVKQGIVKESEAKRLGVKILGGGELKVPLKLALPVSQSAAEKIRKAGGEVVGEAKVKGKVKGKKKEAVEEKEAKRKKKKEGKKGKEEEKKAKKPENKKKAVIREKK